MKEFYGNALELNEALDLKHLLLRKTSGPRHSYILFPDESHKGQLLYADKAFVKKLGELGGRRQTPGAFVQSALLDRIRTQNSLHNNALERLARVQSEAEGGKAVAAELEYVESIEKGMFSDIDYMFSRIGDNGARRGNSDWMARAHQYRRLPVINPVARAGLDIHVESNELFDYIKIRNLFLERSVASQRFLISGQEKYVKEFKKCGDELEDDLGQEILSSSGKNEAVTSVFEGATRTDKLVSAAFNQAVTAYRSGSTQKARARLMSVFLDKEMLESTLGDLVDEERGHVASAFSALTPIMNYALSLAKIMFIYIMLVASLMSAIIYVAVSRMVRPIINLDDAARKIALGDWTQRVVVRSRDEIGRMARSFNKMTENLEKAESEILRNQLELSALYDVSRAIARTIDLDQLLNEILETITRIEVFSLERKGAIFIVDGDRMKIASHIGESPAFTQCCEIKTGECLCGLAATSGEIVISD